MNNNMSYRMSVDNVCTVNNEIEGASAIDRGLDEPLLALTQRRYILFPIRYPDVSVAIQQ